MLVTRVDCNKTMTIITTVTLAWLEPALGFILLEMVSQSNGGAPGLELPLIPQLRGGRGCLDLPAGPSFLSRY